MVAAIAALPAGYVAAPADWRRVDPAALHPSERPGEGEIALAVPGVSSRGLPAERVVVTTLLDGQAILAASGHSGDWVETAAALHLPDRAPQGAPVRRADFDAEMASRATQAAHDPAAAEAALVAWCRAHPDESDDGAAVMDEAHRLGVPAAHIAALWWDAKH